MKNDYMIKRIIIGVAIGTILMFIRGCEVKASTISLEILPNNNCYNYYASSRLRGTFTSGSTNLFRYGGSWNYCIMNTTPPNEDVLYQDLGFYPKDSSGESPLTQNVAYTYTFNFYSGVDLNIDKVEIQYNYMGNNYRTLCKTSPTGNVYESFFTVTCENIKVNSFNNLIHLYPYISNNQSINQAYIFLDRIVTVEEYKNVVDTLTDDNVDISGFSGGGTSFEPPIYNGVIGNIFTLPLQVFQILSNKLTYGCSNFILTGSQLPFYDYGVWNNSLDSNQQFTLKCLRSYIIDDLHFTYYETLGQIVGYLLIGKLLLKKGRALLKMGELSATDEECWGGLE